VIERKKELVRMRRKGRREGKEEEGEGEEIRAST